MRSRPCDAGVLARQRVEVTGSVGALDNHMLLTSTPAQALADHLRVATALRNQSPSYPRRDATYPVSPTSANPRTTTSPCVHTPHVTAPRDRSGASLRSRERAEITLLIVRIATGHAADPHIPGRASAIEARWGSAVAPSS